MSASLLPPFRIRLHSRGARVVVMVSGEVDLCTAPRLREALDHVSRLGAEVVVVDLQEVKFMDCAGLRVLLNAAGQLDQTPGPALYVTRARRQVQKLFELAGVEGALRVLASGTSSDDLARAA